MARLRGIEPPHAAPEAVALSVELQAHKIASPHLYPLPQGERRVFLRPLTLTLSPKGRGVNLVEVEGEEDLAAGDETAKVLVAEI